MYNGFIQCIVYGNGAYNQQTPEQILSGIILYNVDNSSIFHTTGRLWRWYTHAVGLTTRGKHVYIRAHDRS